MKDQHGKKEPTQPGHRGETGGDATATFIIVLALRSRGEGGETQWRWRVRSMETGEERQFLHVADVLAYVATQTGVPLPG
ncbi:MAG: hypothetical protein IT337_02470 [Thermomicrobiales bacterium]|nr:hypothetical protein [Thermomicrobiales bacterium]